MGSGAEGQTQAEVSAEPTALPRAQDLLWGLESLPGRALCPATLPKSSTAPGMSLEGMGWGVPGQRGDAREVILGSQQCWEKPWHNLTDPCLSQGWGNQPWSPPLPLLHPSVMGTSGSLTLFLLHPPFGDGLGFLPASFHFGRSVGREGKGKMVVVNPLLTTGLSGGWHCLEHPKPLHPVPSFPGMLTGNAPPERKHHRISVLGTPNSSSSPLSSAGGGTSPAPLQVLQPHQPHPTPGCRGWSRAGTAPFPGGKGRQGDVEMLTCSVASPLLGPSSPSDLVSLTTPRAVSSPASLPWRREQCRESPPHCSTDRAMATPQQHPQPPHSQPRGPGTPHGHPTATPRAQGHPMAHSHPMAPHMLPKAPGGQWSKPHDRGGRASWRSRNGLGWKGT